MKHLSQKFTLFAFFAVFCTFAAVVIAQDTDEAADCSPEGLATAYENILAQTDISPDSDNPAALFALGAQLQDLALACGYFPNPAETDAAIDRTLQIAPLGRIIAASAVGTDVESILAELETVRGDSFSGQLLYNGVQPALDGTPLGCAGCHNQNAGPATAGTWTRTVEIRLGEEQFADYTPEQYLIESILHPGDYLAPDWNNVMSANYGTRLDLQQLADLLAYLRSQDQALETE